MFRLKASPGVWVEWILWMALALIAYNITFIFDKPIESYRYGATGWPRFILIAIMVGATLQLLFKILQWQNVNDNNQSSPDGFGQMSPTQIVRTLTIFILPLIYIWLLPRTGFYFTTPIFIICYLLVLSVFDWKPLLIVTSVVYGLILLVFTRFFYVSLPVGSWEPFYDINNAIILAVRTGI